MIPALVTIHLQCITKGVSFITVTLHLQCIAKDDTCFIK